MRKIKIIILKFSVFVLYVAFSSQLSAIAKAVECLFINHFFAEERAQLPTQAVESILSCGDEWKYPSISYEL